eukprot:12600934-Heterocapsa_arctica.AAC.1
MELVGLVLLRVVRKHPQILLLLHCTLVIEDLDRHSSHIQLVARRHPTLSSRRGSRPPSSRQWPPSSRTRRSSSAR